MPWLARPGLRAAVERLLGTQELRSRFGAAARERTRSELSPDAATERLMAAYRAR